MAGFMSRIIQQSTLGNLWSRAQVLRYGVNSMNSLLKRSSFALFQERTFSAPPLGVCAGFMGLASYYLTRLGQPNPHAVSSIFGPPPDSYEERFSGSRLRCIARKAAGGDAPENTMAALKYCVENGCKFVEVDVRCCKDAKLLLLNDVGLDRLTDICLPDVSQVNFEAIQHINVAAKHPNRQKYRSANLCLLNDAVDFLLENKAKIMIDIKENDTRILDGLLNLFARKPALHRNAAISAANPWIIYKLRSVDQEIVGALKYQLYSSTAEPDEDGKTVPTKLRYGLNKAVHSYIRGRDVAQAFLCRNAVHWCGISAVLMHKDVASRCAMQYWKNHDIRCIGLGVDTPMEKLYWRRVLKCPYMASTLIGELDLDDLESSEMEEHHAENIVDILLTEQRESESRADNMAR